MFWNEVAGLPGSQLEYRLPGLPTPVFAPEEGHGWMTENQSFWPILSANSVVPHTLAGEPWVGGEELRTHPV